MNKILFVEAKVDSLLGPFREKSTDGGKHGEFVNFFGQSIHNK